VETVIILLVAAGLSAAVVWWASSPPAPRRRRPTPVPDRPRVSFRESFQVTGPEPAPTAGSAEDGFVLASAGSIAPDDRPPPLLSLLRLVLAITFVALVLVGTAAVMWFLVKMQLDRYLGSP
jgi:hypothetical protein